MKAIRLLKQGISASELTISSGVTIPVLKPNEVLIKNSYAGVNFIDIYIRRGMYKSAEPLILGKEGCGIVTKLGTSFATNNPHSIKIGSKICYMNNNGSYAEYTAADASNMVVLPDSTDDIGMQDACAALLQGMTAHMLTHSLKKLDSKSIILVHACFGGTGQLVCQLAKNVFGATVIGTCSKEKKDKFSGTEFASSVDYIVDYSLPRNQKDILDEIRALTHGVGVDLVIDGVGKATYEISLNSVRKKGLVCFFGSASGPVPPIDTQIMSARGSIFVTRASLFDYIEGEQEFNTRATETLAYVQQGKLKITIDEVFALEEVSAAHQYLEAGNSTGKLLLKL